MILPQITITTAGVIESTIIYGCVHGIWTCIKWGLRHLQTDAGKIINHHVKAGHNSRLKHCLEDNCAKLGIAVDQPRPVDPPKILPG